MNEDLTLNINDGIGLITLNRPDEMNTFNAGIREGLGEAYRHCDDNNAVRVIVLTGAGRAFCAGADLSGDGDTFGAGDEMGRGTQNPTPRIPLSQGRSALPVTFGGLDRRGR